MRYQMVKLPAPVALRDPLHEEFGRLTKDEAKGYGQWFLASIPERIAVLSEAVRCSDGYPDWEPDGSDRSFADLGRWFAEHVTIRDRTFDEAQRIYANAPAWFRDVEIASWDLSEQTYSLCFDIGMFFGQWFVDRDKRHRWELLLKQPRNIYHHQMLVTGFGQADCCPVHLMTVLASGLHLGSRNGDRLLELRRIWENMAE